MSFVSLLGVAILFTISSFHTNHEKKTLSGNPDCISKKRHVIKTENTLNQHMNAAKNLTPFYASPINKSKVSFDVDLNPEYVMQQNELTKPDDIILHAITFGRTRTATTVQFNLVCVSLFLHILNFQPSLANNTICNYPGRKFKYLLQNDTIPQVIKTHAIPPKKLVSKSTYLFTTATDALDATTTEELIINVFGPTQKIGYVQDLVTLSELGIEGMTRRYANIFSLSTYQIEVMIEYFNLWDKLRICCGLQMSKYWRNELLRANFNTGNLSLNNESLCFNVVIDDIERQFMDTRLYNLISRYERMKWVNRPSLVDGPLTGKYCSGYNEEVMTNRVGFNQAKNMTSFDASSEGDFLFQFGIQ